LEYCALGEARYRNVETYSTGMKQRIKLAQALVHGPRLLFLDEPTNGLDPGGRDEMLTLIRDVSHGKGVSVIVSSHLLPDIERTCDAVIVMRKGEVVAQGPIAQLKQRTGLQVEVDLRQFSPAFVETLAKKGGALTTRQGPLCRFTFADTNGATGRLILEAAKESGAQVRGFRPAERSLEDIFLEAVDAT
jgi:ABC-2 type transport system ATP-binding protein